MPSHHTLPSLNATDPLNQRVRTDVGTQAQEVVFNAAGHRDSEWDGSTHAQIEGQAYWGNMLLEFYAGGSSHFRHQDWTGTARMQTSNAGSVEGTYTSLPFGDGYTVSGVAGDIAHFATLDHDSETTTDHAQFRQYFNAQGDWMSPDPYDGSYKFFNPQSLNRYSYVLNNPLSLADPSGRCDVVIGGITQSPNISDTAAQQQFANSTGAISAFPYSGGSVMGGIADVEAQEAGPTDVTDVAADALLAAAENPGPINVTTFSGGAEAFTAAMKEHPELSGRINNVTYLSPGLAGGTDLYKGNGQTTALLGQGLIDAIVTKNLPYLILASATEKLDVIIERIARLRIILHFSIARVEIHVRTQRRSYFIEVWVA